MKRLILMRHAKSDWSASGDDHARPLNRRGEKSARAMGDWLRARGWLPDEVLCSSATRTRQTLDLLSLSDTPTRFERDLYLAHSDGIAATLRRAEGNTVLLLGHNYGIADFAARIVTEAPNHDRFHNYPTCATLLAEAEIRHWSDLRLGSMTPQAFAIPREVIAAQT